MSRAKRCDHPADQCSDLVEANLRKHPSCGAPAAVEVRYLGDVNYLCARHHAEASRWNTYQADEVAR